MGIFDKLVNKEKLAEAAAKFKRDVAASKEKRAEEKAAALAEAQEAPTCPKCGSPHLHLDQKKFSVGKAAVGLVALGGVGLIAGAHGRNDLVFTCLKCGKKWSPGEE